MSAPTLTRPLPAQSAPPPVRRAHAAWVALVLHRESARDWTWRPRDLTLHPVQFSPARFEVFQLPNSTVPVVRTSAVVTAPASADQPDDRE